MKNVFKFLILFFCFLSFQIKAQNPVACFSALPGATFPITQCGPFTLNVVNCSTGNYDSSVWNLQLSSTVCAPPWGISFITSNVGALSHGSPPFPLTIDGYYKLCLTVFNRATGASSTTCNCVAISYPFPKIDFSASDTFNCGNLTTIFTPNITLGTPPYGPINWFFGDNVQQSTPTNTNITHTYSCKTTSPPCYTITMTAVDAHGCSKVVTKPCYINVPCAPKPTVSVVGGSFCNLPAIVNFHIAASPLIGSGIYKIWFPPLNSPPQAPSIGPTANSNFSNTYNSLGCKNIIVEVEDSISHCKGLDTLNNAVCLQSIMVDSFVTHTSKVCCGQPIHFKLAAHFNPNTGQPCSIGGFLVATPLGGGAPILLGGINANSNQYLTLPCGNSSAPTVYSICFQNNAVGNSCNACTTTFNGCVQVTIYPSPIAAILQSVTDTVHCSVAHNFCFSANQSLINAGCTYAWSINSIGGAIASTNPNFCTSFNTFGSETIFLNVCQPASNGGCCSNSFLRISQSKPFGTINITQTPQSCGSTCATISVDVSVTDTLYPTTDSAYIYIFGDGTAPLHTQQSSVVHCYTSAIDTCFTVKVIHIPYSMGGVICADTIVKTKAVSIGHHIIPMAQYFPLEQCLIKKDACFTVVPTSHVNEIKNGNCSTICHWFFSQTGTKIPSAQVFSCDTSIVCISDLGEFDAHYQINDNGCIDTSYYVVKAVTVKGILGNITPIYNCKSVGGACVTIVPTFKMFPAQSYPTSVKIIIDQGACGLPQTYNYTVQSGNQPPPINFCFCALGTYKVTMISKNDSLGCPADTTIKFITPNSYHAKLDILPVGTSHKKCGVHDWCFSAAHCLPGRPYNYNLIWDFGDGKRDTMLQGSADTSLVRPCHHYDSCGRFVVKLIMKGICIDTAIDSIFISEIKPSVFLTANTTSCALCYVLHNNTVFCGDELDSTSIYYGNGTSKSIKGPWLTDSICFNQVTSGNGWYRFYTKNGCSKFDYISTPNISGLRACAAPLPDTVVCPGKSITFNNCSGGFVTNACWKINGTSCNQTNPCLSNTLGNFNYTFTNLGYYYLNLQVSNYLGCSDDTCIRIHVANPIANFSGPDTISCPGIFDTLTNLSMGAYDKVVITVSSPPINYFASFQYSINDPNGIPKKMGIPIGYPGDYVICWKITSINGCVDSICKNLHVNGPLGSLTCSNVFGCRGKPICCTLNTNSIANPLVKYPDGAFQILPYSSSNNYPFCHSYSVIGHQLVQAFIDDGLGCSYPLTDTVHIDGVIANFSWSPNIIDFCVKADVTMNDLTIKGLYNLDTANYKWIIKNSSGNVYAIYHHQNPHIIITTPGTYSMMLIAKSLYGCIDTIEKLFVRVHPKPLSQFISSPDTICINDCVTFTNTSVNFDTVKSYTWYFDWANTTPKSNAFNTSYCFVNPGNYQVVLLDSTIYNCVDTSNKHIIVVLSGIQISFTKDKDTVCANATTVHFNSTTTPSINVQQKWFFGDGSSTPLGNFPQATHSYILPPNVTDTCYNIMLIVKTISGCADTLVQQVCLAEVPQPQLIHGNATACEPLKTFFTINSLNGVPIANYQINYGDLSTPYNSNIAPTNLPKTYHNLSHQTVASYTATIQVTSNYKCKATVIDSFKVNPLPIACVGNNDSICPGVPAIIGCPPFPGYQYHWFRPAVLGTFKPSSFIADPHIKIYQTDSFALAVSNQFGCTDTNKIVVHIRPYIVPTFGHDTTICLGDTIHLYASGGVNYQWKNLMTNQIVSYQPDVFIPVFDSTNFQLIIDGKCNADSSSIVHINIFQPKPFVVINPTSATILAGQSYSIKPTTNATFVQWHPNYFIDCDTCINVKVSPDVNTIYHVLTNDLHGCMDSSEVTIKVLCDKSNSIFIPNGFEPKVNAKYENRFFYVQGKGIKEIEFMRIYDRWGSEVFSAEHTPINKPDAGWDGNFRGKPCTCDIYMYQMQVICADGTIFPISGNMTLIR